MCLFVSFVFPGASTIAVVASFAAGGGRVLVPGAAAGSGSSSGIAQFRIILGQLIRISIVFLLICTSSQILLHISRTNCSVET